MLTRMDGRIQPKAKQGSQILPSLDLPPPLRFGAPELRD
jgi:hypothetical protein